MFKLTGANVRESRLLILLRSSAEYFSLIRKAALLEHPLRGAPYAFR